MAVPYDPTRQVYTNDLGRADIEADNARRQAAYRVMLAGAPCYLSTGHDGHDLLEPGQRCKACGWTPEDL